MSVLGRFKALLRRVASARASARGMRAMAVAQEDGAFRGPAAERTRTFEGDYYAAASLLRDRMNGRYPGWLHDRLNAAGRPTYRRGERREDVVDAASTAIAMALRDGATVEDAAEAGADSVGV